MESGGPSRIVGALSPGSPSSGLIDRPRPRQFVIVFAASFLIGFGLLLAPFVQPQVRRFSCWLVTISAALIRACGGAVDTEGAILRQPLTGFAIEMRDGCNAVNVTILLWSAVLAFHASWSQKAKGLVIGALAIQLVNFIRFISLFYLGQYSATWFEFAHAYLWETLIVFDTMVVFWLWVQFVSRSRALPSASP
jgi:exosortase H (IPTLxxWG-CTERM-specific)